MIIDPELEEQQQRENREFVNSYFQQVFQPHFPNQYFGGVSNFGGINTWNLRPIPELSPRFGNFRDSMYFLNPENLKFIHYTTLPNLYNILNDGAVRMYDANAMSDQRECFVGSDELPFYAHNIKQMKAMTYLFSFNNYDPDISPENLSLWRQYGNDGRGCALVFSLEGDFENWKHFILSKIYYGKEMLHHFTTMSKVHEKFTKGTMKIKGNIFPESDGKMLDEMIKFLAFHKEGIYNDEKEVRLMQYIPYIHHNESTFYHALNRKLEKITYVKLPLKTGREIIPKSTVPMLNLEKIILGYSFSKERLYRSSMNFHDIAANTINKRVEVQLSSLYDAM